MDRKEERWKRGDRRDERNEILKAFYRDMDEVRQRYHERLYANGHFADDRRMSRYRLYHRHTHYARPIAGVLMLAFWAALIAFGGFPLWLRVVVATVAAFSTVGGAMEMVFLLRMDRRVIVPLEKIESAAREISRGNFDVRIEGFFHPETANLITTFNSMARSLKEGDELKKKYEQDRRDLVANVSHDLKTPITSIIGYVDAIEDIGNGDRARISRYLSIVRSNARYLNALIDDLSLFSRLDVHRLDLSLRLVLVRDFLRDLWEELALEYEDKGATLEYRDGFDLGSANAREPIARVDPQYVRRIVRNILDNARKYGPKRGLRVSAEARPLDRVRDEAEGSTERFALTIADNGPGLPEESLPHLFERFYRVDAERTKDSEGTGLGLAIAKEIAEAHGGSISARNGADGGLEIELILPLEREDAER